MRMLVIGSCTGSKADAGCPANHKCTVGDFDNAERLQACEARLRAWMRPAHAMYTGRQHTQMMQGVAGLRAFFGRDTCDVAIISAGYGLIPEDRPIAPYDITFQGMRPKEIKERGRRLGIPLAVRQKVKGYDVVVLLLGDDYLRSAAPPIEPQDGQRFIAFGSPQMRSTSTGSVVVVPAAQQEAKVFGDGIVTLKGRMFHLLSQGMCAQPAVWPDVCRMSVQKIYDLMQLGRSRL